MTIAGKHRRWGHSFIWVFGTWFLPSLLTTQNPVFTSNVILAQWGWQDIQSSWGRETQRARWQPIYFSRRGKKVANILAKKITLHLVFFSRLFLQLMRKKNLFKFTQNGIYTVYFAAAVFKCVTFQVTMKHFFEICLNLSFSVTMKLPGSSACDMTELGCSWPTAMIIRHCCWESWRGWRTILKENHAALCMGEVTPMELDSSLSEISVQSYSQYRTRAA